MGVRAKSNRIRRMVWAYSLASLWLLCCIVKISDSAAKKDTFDFSFYSAIAVAWMVLWLLYMRSCIKVIRGKWIWFYSIFSLLAILLWALMKIHFWMAVIALGAAAVDQIAMLVIAQRTSLDSQSSYPMPDPSA